MAPRRGRLVRPLLQVTREETRAYCRARGLDWREDPSNEDVLFARARVRSEVLPALRELNPAAERNIAETAALLREESELLAELTPPGPASLAELRELPAPIARLALRAAAGDVAISRRDADRILGLSDEGSSALDLPGGVRAVAEYGSLRFERGPDPGPPAPIELRVPGSVEFGEWVVEAEPGGDGDVTLDGAALTQTLTVRSWRPGDRIRLPGGTKTLQDLFTDRKVPRAERARVPVLESGGRIVWVAGLAVDERARAERGAGVAVSARRLRS
jgi:tRNA(Ile)-lysidine synthase